MCQSVSPGINFQVLQPVYTTLSENTSSTLQKINYNSEQHQNKNTFK